MLSNLFIKNYALIEELSVNFQDNLSIITGETGAGKSILLGALGLVLGKRADTTVLKNDTEKCIIEAQFNIHNYNLHSIFNEFDVDYEESTIIRREILPSGKSRAFVNDTPATLKLLQKLSSKLIDVHSQHQTLDLANEDFQFKVVDTLAENAKEIANYKVELNTYKQLKTELEELQSKQIEAKAQYQYNLHLFEELDKANFKKDEQQEIEQQLSKLNNVEAIKLNLSEALSISHNEDYGLQHLLNQMQNNLSKIADYSSNFKELSTRIESVNIEFNDILTEIETEFEAVDFNEDALEELNQRLQLIFNLQKKHLVTSVEELLEIKTQLETKVLGVENLSQQIAKKQNQLNKIIANLNVIASKISDARLKSIPQLIKKTESILAVLGMENTRLKIDLATTEAFLPNGKNKLTFQISADKGVSFGSIKKIASGGELSRIMLAFKYILSSNLKLPTVIFDEIDAGVSGDVSEKMGDIMTQLGNNMQVITITHLPQIAAKGKHHFKVYKTDKNNNIVTQLKLLNNEERVVEIAEMLSSKNLTETAIDHAKELLN
ncbi:MAG TPA: DNA repair protein RecN [Flavobacteriaceae bacterium]|nr:DNA repair protein RecN [Flavobacteriaceae bacterium]